MASSLPPHAMTSATATLAQRKPPRTKGGRPPSAKRSTRRGESAPHGTGVAGVPIVGIGASAGGLEALSEFFDAMPADSGLAFVIVLHLDPNHKSQMHTLIGRHTKMRVVEIVDRMVVEANRVYVIAPDHYLTVRNQVLRLVKSKDPRGRRRPVDAFFAALAEDQHESAICIVLSGTGSDGSTALPEVKVKGGLVLAQEPQTAKFDGMPQAAIATGTVDHVLAPKEHARGLGELPPSCCIHRACGACECGARDIGSHSRSSSGPHRARLSQLQTEHGAAPHPAPDGPHNATRCADMPASWIQQAGGRGAGPGHDGDRHRILPRSRGMASARARGHRAAGCGQSSGVVDPHLGSRVRVRRRALFDRDAVAERRRRQQELAESRYSPPTSRTAI